MLATTAASPTAHQPAILPIEIVNNHVYVRVCHGDRPLWFLLDTGSASTLLDLTAARAAGIPLGARLEARGGGSGSMAGAQLTGATIRIAETGATISVPAALDLSGLAGYEGRMPQGILGQDFIGRSVVAIDYHARQIRLYDADRFHYAGDGTRVPVALGSGHPHVRAELVLDDGSVVPADGVVDVGSALALSLTKPLVERFRLRDRIARQRGRAMGRGAGGPMRADVGRIAQLRIGTRSIERPVTALYGDDAGVFTTGSHFEANIGGDILRRFTVFFDYRRCEMILEPNADVAEPFETDMSGLEVSFDAAANAFVVESVAPDTPAATAGLRPGDVISSVDGRPPTAITLDAFRRLLRRDGATVSVHVRRAGRDVDLSLVLRRLV
jgi:hypothetical protein